jgi:hypothetical protein
MLYQLSYHGFETRLSGALWYYPLRTYEDEARMPKIIFRKIGAFLLCEGCGFRSSLPIRKRNHRIDYLPNSETQSVTVLVVFQQLGRMSSVNPCCESEGTGAKL